MSKFKIIIHNSKLIIPALLFWQFVSVYLMAVGAFPATVTWLNLGLILLFIVLSPAFEGLLLAVASIPFYLVLPQHYSDTLSMWRLVAAVLFLKAGVEMLGSWSGSSPRIGEAGRGTMNYTSPNLSYIRRGINAARRNLSSIYSALFAYEKLAIALFILGVLSLGLARYPLRGASQLIFLLNTALLYPIVVWVVKSREQFVRLLKYGAISTGIIILLGYVQFIITLFTNTYYFWQYWAMRVSSLYYGLTLSKVLQYSNSWVTISGEVKTLRMFSIMPSSHAFAMVCVLFLAFALPLFYVEGHPLHKKRWLMTSIILACLALILSGTRGVWTGMVPVLLLSLGVYYRTRLKAVIKPMLAAMLLVVVLFQVSPVLDRALNYIRHSGSQSQISRFASVINPNETSNAGRLVMWKAASLYALQHPFGVGYANFVVSLNSASTEVSFEEVASQENDLYNLPQRYVTAHSLYLQLLVELSVIGLILFGLFWFFYYLNVWRYLGRTAKETSPETVYIATVSIIFLWFLAYSVFDLTWLNDKILLYTFLALGLGRGVLLFDMTDMTDKTNRTDK